jgi:hypothetical protein
MRRRQQEQAELVTTEPVVESPFAEESGSEQVARQPLDALLESRVFFQTLIQRAPDHPRTSESRNRRYDGTPLKCRRVF